MANIHELADELARLYPNEIIEIKIGTTMSVSRVPASRREAYERKVKQDARRAAIALGFAKCRKCGERREHREVCGCADPWAGVKG